jgi:hypothetical protein
MNQSRGESKLQDNGIHRLVLNEFNLFSYSSRMHVNIHGSLMMSAPQKMKNAVIASDKEII